MLNKPQGQRVKHKTNMGQALAPTPPVCPSISPQNQLLVEPNNFHLSIGKKSMMQ